ncbi:MAG: response regulator [Proteobacteria bacterium]|nr:response regulator [Pseudomonadota bacterium]
MSTVDNSFNQTEIRFLVEKNADGIIVLDGDGVVLFANPAAEQIFGRPLAVLIGSPIGIPFTADEATEIAIPRPDGRLVEAEIRVVDTVWGQRSARLATLRDVSARKVIEERLRHTAKMEALGRLTAGIAHDFNNLLTVVLGNLESARHHLPSGKMPPLEQAVDNAVRGAERAADLTKRLLAFARRQPLEPRSIDVNALVTGMSDLLRRTLGEEIGVRTILAGDLWAVHADPTELEAAILNLAVNARDAMPHGGQLKIMTANVGPLDEAQAAEFGLKPNAYVAIDVEDSGIGISTELLKQVFEPFFTTKGGHGTGLGLSQVHGFATQSGGTATLQSEPQRGTTVRIYLPKAEVPIPERQILRSPIATGVARARHGETILVVEDDEGVRQHTVGVLRDLGYTVLEAVDALQALQIVDHETTLHLVLTDLGLPGGLDGKVLGKRVRMLRPSLPVLIMTAYAASSLIHDGRVDADVDLLTKPFTRETLANRVRELLDRNEQRDNRTLHILLVEDEVLVRMYAAQTLGALGFAVEEAGTFQEACTKMDHLGDSLTVTIVDLGLPDRPGEELIAEIRLRHPTVPIILTTGYADAALQQRILQDTMLQLVSKPFQPHDLERALARLGVRPDISTKKH